MQVKVIEEYRTPDHDPITFAAGEAVDVGHRDDEYPGWIWAKAKSSNHGWVPESILKIDSLGSQAIALEAYSAKELNTYSGEWLTVHRVLNQKT
ncbi:MAG: SH3 domain-containing protein [Cyanobacteria bacterium J06635_15]